MNAHEHRYWIGVVAADDVELAQARGYAELNHGKAGALERLRPGDGVTFYSPRAHADAREPLQHFTAIGRVAEGRVYSAADTTNAAEAGHYRRPFVYVPAHAAPVRALLDHLTFIRDRQHWGVAFRYGVLRISSRDFARIALAMGCDPRREFGIEAPTETLPLAAEQRV